MTWKCDNTSRGFCSIHWAKKTIRPSINSNYNINSINKQAINYNESGVALVTSNVDVGDWLLNYKIDKNYECECFNWKIWTGEHTLDIICCCISWIIAWINKKGFLLGILMNKDFLMPKIEIFKLSK